MLNKMGLGGLFAQKSDHPLADPREFRRILGELPQDNAFKALDEIIAWFESLVTAEQFPAERLYDVLRQFEDAAVPHLRRLAREYFQSARLSRAEERRLWSINYGFWRLLADAYDRCLLAFADGGRPAEALKVALPQLCVRLIGALGAVLKWEQFHYGPVPHTIWGRLGNAVLVAARESAASKSVSVGAPARVTSPLQEFQKVMIFQSASLDSLRPLEIELAERLVAHFLPGFVCTAKALPDSVYWIDLRVAHPPQRLAKMPAKAESTQRFFKPGAAHDDMKALLAQLERGGEVPSDINLGAQYAAKTLVPVLRHLVAYLAPIPPQRRHDRHRVMHRMSVMNGLVNAFVVFSGEFGGRPAGLQMESWVVENVSRGGFGSLLKSIAGEWLKVGALVAMQPEGGENWLLGIVRRYRRENGIEARVGIETLARRIFSVELKPCTASSYAAAAGVPGLLLLDGNEADELRVVLPFATFDLLESLEYTADGQRCILEPVALVEQTTDYELARYRRSATG